MGNCLALQQSHSKAEVEQVGGPGSREEQQEEEDVIRIKLVLSRQEVEEILKQGGISHGDMMSLLQREVSKNCSTEKRRSSDWKPTLERIPEVQNLC
ncbi:hypothetical protein ZIOFF_055956 [Zingiber officinale]|uniref:Uncharacterized protein n=1 Tax=Zingiber officinale TaxID=94328 RepID=A0A8J5KSK7_ZINOF|nr:hypothetical protein ZIOFF_055956 [Zingiber officinale]